MSRSTDFHHWDEVAPDAQKLRKYDDTTPEWAHSVHSNFAQPSRLGGLNEGRRSRRTASLNAAGVVVAVAVVLLAALAAWLRR